MCILPGSAGHIFFIHIKRESLCQLYRAIPQDPSQPPVKKQIPRMESTKGNRKASFDKGNGFLYDAAPTRRIFHGERGENRKKAASQHFGFDG